jgi:hypothetical protein
MRIQLQCQDVPVILLLLYCNQDFAEALQWLASPFNVGIVVTRSFLNAYAPNLRRPSNKVTRSFLNNRLCASVCE